MPDVEPNKVKAIRALLALKLGIDPNAIEARERTVPGSAKDEPFYVTLLIPRIEGLNDAAIDAAVTEVEAGAWQHPAYPWQLRWEYKR